MLKRKDAIIFAFLFIISLFVYFALEGKSIDVQTLFKKEDLSKVAFEVSETEKPVFALKQEVQKDNENRFEKDVDFLEEFYEKGYTKMKSANWSYDTDVLRNGNIPLLVEILDQLEVSEWPATSYYNMSVSYVKNHSDEEDCYGERFWFNMVYIDQMELIEAGSEYANLVNSGDAFYAIYGHLENEELILLFIMSPEGVENYYGDVAKKKMVSNMQGWYVGNFKEIPVFCLPRLYGGG